MSASADGLLDRMGRNLPEETPLLRAHSIVISAGGDTARDLARELYRLAGEIERGELTKGCSGSPLGGSVYSYVHDPSMTHDRYFEEIDRLLRAERDGE